MKLLTNVTLPMNKKKEVCLSIMGLMEESGGSIPLKNTRWFKGAKGSLYTADRLHLGPQT